MKQRLRVVVIFAMSLLIILSAFFTLYGFEKRYVSVSVPNDVPKGESDYKKWEKGFDEYLKERIEKYTRGGMPYYAAYATILQEYKEDHPAPEPEPYQSPPEKLRTIVKTKWVLIRDVDFVRGGVPGLATLIVGGLLLYLITLEEKKKEEP